MKITDTFNINYFFNSIICIYSDFTGSKELGPLECLREDTNRTRRGPSKDSTLFIIIINNTYKSRRVVVFDCLSVTEGFQDRIGLKQLLF